MIDRTPGEGRYAQPEREQRWLLRELPDDLSDPVTIVDLYITGTRLRVRSMETTTGMSYKLCQKVRARPDDPHEVRITNMYLSEAEYDIFARLEGHEIRKRRRHWTGGGRPIAVDEFDGPLRGLFLAELELTLDEPRQEDPPFALRDVTDDDRFSGGRLATTTAEDLRGLLVRLGAGPPMSAPPERGQV